MQLRSEYLDWKYVEDGWIGQQAIAGADGTRYRCYLEIWYPDWSNPTVKAIILVDIEQGKDQPPRIVLYNAVDVLRVNDYQTAVTTAQSIGYTPVNDKQLMATLLDTLALLRQHIQAQEDGGRVKRLYVAENQVAPSGWQADYLLECIRSSLRIAGGLLTQDALAVQSLDSKAIEQSSVPIADLALYTLYHEQILARLIKESAIPEDKLQLAHTGIRDLRKALKKLQDVPDLIS